jgi:hypothetical protein
MGALSQITRGCRLPLAALLSVTLLCGLAAACTAIGNERVQGWPRLAVVEHYVPHAEMRDRCVKYVAFGESPAACAEFNFEARRCDIWFSADFPPPPFMIEHERKHCLGYEHAGEHHLREALERYKAAGRPG